MTRKDYKIIASAINRVYCGSPCDLDVIKSLSNALSCDNPMFNSVKFIDACKTGKRL